MYKLEVTADKLNVRNSPDADSTYANWVGDMNKGEVFNAVHLIKGKLYDGSDDWYADEMNRMIWKGATKNLPLSDDNNLSRKIILNNSIDSTGQGIVIGILDTGIDTKNPSLKAAYLSDEDYLTQTHSADLKNNHGTKVAGVLVGNDDKISGFAIDAKIRSFRTNDSDGNTDDNAVVTALKYIITNNIQIDILNLSLDITNTVRDDVQACINTLTDKGVIVVVAGFSQLFGDVSNLANIRGTFPVGIIEESDFSDVKKNGINPIYQCAYLDSNINTMGISGSDDPHPPFKSSSAYTAVTTGIIAKFLSSKNIPSSARITEVKNFLAGNSFKIQTETDIKPFKPYINEKT